jgi:hypothetical protein
MTTSTKYRSSNIINFAVLQAGKLWLGLELGLSQLEAINMAQA